MALLAGLGEAGCHVVRICRALIVLQMAADAGRTGQVEVVVDMTVGTLARGDCMSARERKTSRTVIEVRAEPGIGVVAKSTVRGKATRSVVGIAGGLEIRGVTGVAVGGHRLKTAGGSSLVARIAIHRRVRAGQGKAIVVLLHFPNGNLPSANGMALLAVCSQLALVDVGMAILAPLSHAGEYGPDVTLGAGDGLVHTSQRIFGLVVVEFGNGANRSPRIGCVAILAGYIQVPVGTVRASRLRPRYTGCAGKRQHKQ